VRAAVRGTNFARTVRSLGELRPITHPVKFYEKGERPLEIVTSRQWFVSTLARREELLKRGEELHWVPDYNETHVTSPGWRASRRLEPSRASGFFGVPFPRVVSDRDASGEILF